MSKQNAQRIVRRRLGRDDVFLRKVYGGPVLMQAMGPDGVIVTLGTADGYRELVEKVLPQVALSMSTV